MVTRDVQKAFDKVWHKSIIYKLLQAGVDKKLTRILANFLHSRRAYVRVNKHKGETFKMTAGVPQGDVLSPTLFLIVGNDYPEPTRNNSQKNFAMQYADDFTQIIISKFNTTITQACRDQHKNNVEEEIRKQNDFERRWKIKTNVNKFTIINIGFFIAPTIVINNTPIPYVTHTKLLGLHLTRNNFYVKQIQQNTIRARAELKKLQRFKSLKPKLKVRLYKALILPLLTYPVVPLNISSKTQIKKLQVIQNKAIRWITNEHWPIICPIALRQEQLRIEPLDQRLQRLADGVWKQVLEENEEFHRSSMLIQMINPHPWFPSSRGRALI